MSVSVNYIHFRHQHEDVRVKKSKDRRQITVRDVGVLWPFTAWKLMNVANISLPVLYYFFISYFSHFPHDLWHNYHIL